MNGIKTRRQAAEEDQKPVNGQNGSIDRARDPAADTELSENIFLFYPNIIGTS